MLDLEITLSDWVYRSVISKNVLTLPRDYFRLRKPFERRMYELARKHCGVKDEWKIGLALLQHKRSEEQTSELQSLLRTSYAGFCLKQTTISSTHKKTTN